MSDIKSTAVVKYSAVKSPAPYCELELNTNLNSPPSKWVHGRFSEKESFIPGRSSGTAGKEMNSFVIANDNLDYVGSVDAITDAEIVKKLLKMPYSKSSVSMMVHRVGKSLLIDHFDVYKHVLLAQQQEWKWLQDFIIDTLLDANALQAKFPASNKDVDRKDVQENLMLSKFLSYSSAAGQGNVENEASVSVSPRSKRSILVPDPLGTEDAAGIEQRNLYQRNVLWKLEDIRMLVGNDMPIFGGGKHPCVSLRLGDMKKPINVLTGIDYWLDQLMCNVPEVVMCYHLNGIVQKYEVIKTEDLPNLPDCQFNPEIVRDVAQNILSFLKSKATKEGHTYWLFKGHGDDVVKLYDLTSICKEYMTDDYVNPFTLPVAVLMYRVARNLLQKVQSISASKAAPTVYRLLNYCLELIDKNLFPQICGSVNYLLATLYITYGCPIAENKETVDGHESGKGALDEELDDNFDDSLDLSDWYTYDDDPCPGVLPLGKPLNSKQGSNCSSVSLKVLTTMNPSNNDEPQQASSQNAGNDSRRIPNCTNLEDCCKTALEHIYESLECIEIYTSACSQRDQGSESGVESTAKIADLSRPISLRYEPLARSESSAKLLPLAVRHPTAATSSFQPELSALLMAKAATAYYLLAECSFKLGNYGKSLRYVNLMLLCYESLNHSFDENVQRMDNGSAVVQAKRQADVLSRNVLLLCGDVHLNVVRQDPQTLRKDRRDLTLQVYRDDKIAEKTKQSMPENYQSAYAWCTELPESMEQNLALGVKCYEAAGKLVKEAVAAGECGGGGSPKKSSKTGDGGDGFSNLVVDSVIIAKRQGNAKNELGLYYMNVALAILSKEQDPKAATEKVEKYWQASYVCFQEGISIFRASNDDANEALLCCNCARLMRACAHSLMDAKEQCGSEERHYYRKAIEFYQRALECVQRKSCSESDIADSVAWDLSSTYFAQATQLQERPPLNLYSVEEIERDIVDCMHKALRLVESLERSNSSKRDVYSYRSSVIHHKLASLYYRLFIEKERDNDKKARQQKQLAELHYSKASDGFRELVAENPCEFVRVQLERLALLEHGVDNVGLTTKQKVCRDAFQLLISCRAAFVSLCRKFSSQPSAADDQSPSSATEELITTHSGGRQREQLDQTGGSEIDQSLLKECASLCDLTQQRLQALCKLLLKLHRPGASSDAKTRHTKKPESDKSYDRLKGAYGVTLKTKPKEMVEMPGFILMVIDQLSRELAM